MQWVSVPRVQGPLGRSRELYCKQWYFGVQALPHERVSYATFICGLTGRSGGTGVAVYQEYCKTHKYFPSDSTKHGLYSCFSCSHILLRSIYKFPITLSFVTGTVDRSRQTVKWNFNFRCKIIKDNYVEQSWTCNGTAYTIVLRPGFWLSATVALGVSVKCFPYCQKSHTMLQCLRIYSK